jgi:hypothetical protein
MIKATEMFPQRDIDSNRIQPLIPGFSRYPAQDHDLPLQRLLNLQQLPSQELLRTTDSSISPLQYQLLAQSRSFIPAVNPIIQMQLLSRPSTFSAEIVAELERRAALERAISDRLREIASTGSRAFIPTYSLGNVNSFHQG